MECVSCKNRHCLVEDVGSGDLVCTKCGVVNPDSARAVTRVTAEAGPSKRQKRARESLDISLGLPNSRSELPNSRSDGCAPSTSRTQNDDALPPQSSFEETWGPPSDTEVALEVLKSQFPKLQGEVVPLLLKTQIYSMVKNRTDVDRTLNSLRQKYVLRLFKLPTGADDYAVVFTRDYIEMVAGCKARA
eukprot:CAMPEP_0118940676 /NCGR_PEP_ID=MMETSP1169-20130426/32016_1 /TAXON_ID=36882 /ORGANISM="Pyramimonas obovata, Strain CCMP722" /LENGTH=188 /DNA_ID=CAMNT_0006885229 /DNA_START=74 /DNA_END=637 /DNA_ORIENTATION=+